MENIVAEFSDKVYKTLIPSILKQFTILSSLHITWQVNENFKCSSTLMYEVIQIRVGLSKLYSYIQMTQLKYICKQNEANKPIFKMQIHVHKPSHPNLLKYYRIWR